MEVKNKFNQSVVNFITASLMPPIRMLVGFIATPLLLTWLGEERVALYKILEESVLYLALLELGLSMALVPIFSKAVGTGEESVLRSAFKTGGRLYLLTLPLIGIAGLVLYFFLPNLYDFQGIPTQEVGICYLYLAASTIFLPFRTFEYYLSANQEKYLVNIVYLMRFLTFTTFSLLLAYLGMGLKGQGIAYFLAAFVVGSLFYFFGKSGSGSLFELVKHQVKVSHEVVCSWKDRFTSTLLNLSLQLSIYTDNLIIGIFIGPHKVVPFFITMKLVLATQTILYAFSNSVWASLADFYYKRELETLKLKVIEVNKVITLAALICFTPILIFNQDFVSLWVGEKYWGGGLLTLLGCIFVFLNSLSSFWGLLFLSLGQLQSQGFPSVVGTFINVIFSVIITYYYGIIGPVAGSVISLLFLNPYYARKFLDKELGIKLGDHLRSIILPVTSMIITLPIFYKVKEILPFDFNWFTLLPTMAAFALLEALIVLPIFLSSREREIWFRRIKGVFIK